ncbi:MAG: HAD family hydrolase [Clostridiales bacterium]|nr:HAD family hydrolase [Clostridiales bacterium]
MDSIIFDVDGTLWDSTAVCAEAWNTVIRQEDPGLPLLTAETLRGLFGKPLPEIASIVFSRESRQRQLELIDACCQEEHRALLEKGSPLYPGLEETLKALGKSYRLFIVSNSQAGYIEVFLQASGLASLFEGHLCAGDTGKPKGDNIRSVVERYQLDSPVYVGDTLGDFQAARQAGTPFVYAAYGFGEVPYPDYTIHLPEDLLNIF